VPLTGAGGAEIRLHQTVLYGSIYRADSKGNQRARLRRTGRTFAGPLPKCDRCRRYDRFFLGGFDRIWHDAS
jgi:hypothetical protein